MGDYTTKEIELLKELAAEKDKQKAIDLINQQKEAAISIKKDEIRDIENKAIADIKALEN